MPTVGLTKRVADEARPEQGDDGQPRRTIYFDRDLKGFGLMITERGAKTFVLKYRAGVGRAAPTRRVTIGRYGSPWTVEQARIEAKRLLGEVVRGRDPAAERAAKRRGVDETRTVTAVTERWLQRDQVRNRTVEEVRRIMAREVLPYLGSLPMSEVRKRDIIDVVDRVADRAPVRANRVLAHIKRLFRWAAGRDLIEIDPAAHIEKPTPERKRDRVLDDKELATVWRAAVALEGPFGAGVQLLIATGARREEVFALTRAEIDRDAACIRLPATRNKVNEPRVIPLSPMALGILDSVPEFGPYLISSRGDKPFGNMGRGKAQLDALIARRRAERRLGRELLPEEQSDADDALAPWRLHDLRRTVATGMQRLGVRLEVIEAVLGHVSGSRAGIVGVYQRHRYVEEAREALAAWGAHVQRLIDGSTTGAEVVPLRRA